MSLLDTDQALSHAKGHSNISVAKAGARAGAFTNPVRQVVREIRDLLRLKTDLND